MVAVLLVKDYQIKLLKNAWYILLVLCTSLIHFPFNVRDNKTIKILMQ